jgi:uncharacterized membrane protein
MSKGIIFYFTIVFYILGNVLPPAISWVAYGLAWLLTVMIVAAMMSSAADYIFASFTGKQK